MSGERWEVWWRPDGYRDSLLFSDTLTSYEDAQHYIEAWKVQISGEFEARRKVVPLRAG